MSEPLDALITVLQTNDASLLAIAQSMLDGESIPYIAKGGGLRNLVVPDGLGVSSNLAVGVVELQVSPDDAEDARAVLQDLLRDMEKSP
jgi:hypothetical protein